MKQKLSKRSPTKLSSAGFTFAAVFVMLITVGIIGWYGYQSLTTSHAEVNSIYAYSINSKDGCYLAGRTYDLATSTCQTDCRVQGNAAVFYVHASGGGYCSTYIAAGIDEPTCINDLKRMYIAGLGCARLAKFEAANGNKQCQPAFPYYETTTNNERCIAVSKP